MAIYTLRLKHLTEKVRTIRITDSLYGYHSPLHKKVEQTLDKLYTALLK